MEISKEQFDLRFKEVLDSMAEEMAGNPEIDVKRFYGLVCFMENLSYFSPFIYGLIDTAKGRGDKSS
jgi:hypothetical protein